MDSKWTSRQRCRHQQINPWSSNYKDSLVLSINLLIYHAKAISSMILSHCRDSHFKKEFLNLTPFSFRGVGRYLPTNCLPRVRSPNYSSALPRTLLFPRVYFSLFKRQLHLIKYNIPSDLPLRQHYMGSGKKSAKISRKNL